jgi:hypothetical protein
MDNPETLETLGRQKNVQTNYDRYQKQTQKHFGKQYTNVLTEKKEDPSVEIETFYILKLCQYTVNAKQL